jgi:hypothetical protein
MANRAPQPNAVGHMGGAKVAHQSFTRLMLQLFKAGGTDAQLLGMGERDKPARFIAQHLKHDLSHRYLLGSGLILSGFNPADWCSG